MRVCPPPTGAMVLEGEKKDEAEDNLENKEKDSKDDGDSVGDQDDQEEKKDHSEDVKANGEPKSRGGWGR